jgi:hypothetical protein
VTGFRDGVDSVFPMTQRPFTTSLTVALALVAVVALGACSSSDDSDSSASGSSASTTASDGGGDGSGGDASTTVDQGSAAALPSDPCALLTPDQVAPLLGSAQDGTVGASSTEPGGPQFTSCQWGELTTDAGQLSVGVSTPSGDGGIDYLATLAGATGVESTPSSVGEDGKVLAAFIRPGGGGVGKTVMFTRDGVTVLVARSGATVDTAALETAAGQVAANL